MIRTYERDEKPPFAFCESIHASGTSPWHLRKITAAGLKLGGGIDTPSLCGRVERGWDLNVRITVREREEAQLYQREVRPVVFYPEPPCGDWMSCEP